MPSLTHCLISHKLLGRIHTAELKEVAAEHVKAGLPEHEAMIRATQEYLDLARAQEARIMATVREQYTAATGKPDRQPADGVAAHENGDPETDHGYNDPYDQAQIRPGTRSAQVGAGRAALGDLSRRVGADRIGARDHHETARGSVLGFRLLGNFEAGRPNQLIGHEARTPGDLAALAQVYRDPRFETFRVIYIDGDTVVGEAGYTSRLPAVVMAPAKLGERITVDMARFGADGYYLMHNHPSGSAEPSPEDSRMTRQVADSVPGMRAHVVIDHNEYAVLDADGQHQVVKAPELNGRDFTSAPALEHELLGVKVTGPGEVAQLAKSLQIPQGHATLVLNDADSRVQLLVDVPMGALRDTSPAGLVKGKALMRRMARTSGSGGHRFIVLPDGVDVDQFHAWVNEGVVTDVVSADGTTARANGAHWPSDFLGKSGTVFALGQKEGAPYDPAAERADDRRSAGTAHLPDAIIGAELGALSKHPDYAAAKSGDIGAAVRVVHDVVQPDLVERVRALAGDHNPIIQPVTAVEASGRNAIPMVASGRLGAQLGLDVSHDIVQSSSPKRTSLAGVDRLFARPTFDGPVEPGRSYILVDDTITQGGTFAALAKHIEDGGGHVLGTVALTGKQYSAKMALSDSTLAKLREQHGDIEQQFRAAAGHGFDALTESEGRYLTSYRPADALRNRILARVQPAGDRSGSEGVRQEAGGPDVKQAVEPYTSSAPDGAPAVPERDRDADKTALSRLISVPKAALQSVLFHTRMLVAPMASGDVKAMAMAKDFANHNRRAAAQWQAFDKVLRTHYTDEQLQKMWIAADQENDLRRDGRTSNTEGLASLDAGERKTVELLHAYGEQLWAKARDAGLVEGDGVAFWTPRVAARIVEDGSVEGIRQPAGEFSKDAKNLRTNASSTKQRQHATTAESEAALKAKLGDDAEYVKNIRVMPMAMAQLERAIVGRTLVNQIRAHGKIAGEDLISDQSGPNFVTFDHPALKQWRPRMDWQPADMSKIADRGYDVRSDGVYQGDEKLASYRVQAGAVEKLGPLLDSAGKPVMESTPLYVRRDFAGPLKAVFTKEQNAVYRGLMNLKGAVTSMIMVSPLTHNLVIWGKAMPTMISTMGWKNNLKNAGTLGLHGYFVGNAARADHGLMSELIEAGLVPVSGRGMNPDVEAIGNGLKPGRSMAAQAIGHVFDLASPKAGDLARRGVDKAGEVWHEKLLWDRVADLQAGMAVMMRASLMDKGVDQYTANRMATHFANRYAGMIPQEAMSQGAHMLLNLSLFSKSFTMTNLGAYKDLVGGLPKDVQAQIRTRAFEIQRGLGRDEADAHEAAGAELAQAQGIARRKAAAVLVLDVAAMTTVASLAQALWQGQTGQRIADDFKERLAKLGHKLADDPMAIIGHPLDALSSLSQTADNPHGREDRVRVGEDENGNSYYARLPVGKVGEELKQYGNLSTGMHLAHNKMSTFLRPIADLTANEDATGRRIIDPGDNVVKQAAKFGAYWVKSQLPLEDMAALAHVARGSADTMDKLKLLGTATGLSVSRLAGGDEVAEMRNQIREQDAQLRDALPDARELVRRGDIAGAEDLLEAAGQPPREIQRTIRRIEQPDHLSRTQVRRFNQVATDEERERLERMRAHR